MIVKKYDIAKINLERCIGLFPIFYEAHLKIGFVCIKLKEY